MPSPHRVFKNSSSGGPVRNYIPTRFLAPIDCLKIPALTSLQTHAYISCLTVPQCTIHIAQLRYKILFVCIVCHVEARVKGQNKIYAVVFGNFWIARENTKDSNPQGADPPPPPLRAAKASRNHFNEEITPLLPTGICERYSQTISI